MSETTSGYSPQNITVRPWLCSGSATWPMNSASSLPTLPSLAARALFPAVGIVRHSHIVRFIG